MPDVSVIVVSYNTRALTLACLASVYRQTRAAGIEVLVVDNASGDGSAEAIRTEFPQARLWALDRNLGFAGANNLAAEHARGRYLLLLNPDTVVLNGAIDTLWQFAEAHPELGIYGGRTLFEDGALNPTSCWARMTPWSLLCNALGLSVALRQSRWLNPEALGGWQRDAVRAVDIVTGCFLLITRELWQTLGGFDAAFFMYGEEADLCLRARRHGARPTICPDATIIHYGGRSERSHEDKLVRQLKARCQLLERHWRPRDVWLGYMLQAAWVVQRRLTWNTLAMLRRRGAAEQAATYAAVWRRRAAWLQRSRVRGDAPATLAAATGECG